MIRFDLLFSKTTRRRIRKFVYFPTDLLNFFFRKKGVLLPPQGLNFVGDGNFIEIGNRFLKYFINLGQLKPYHQVLDIGCGIGRMAIPLTGYLDSRAGYEGFDIIPEGIHWCQKNITPVFPNFHFQLADIINKEYNPHGRHAASEYTFLYKNEVFDFVILTSIFTHMLPDEVDQYLSEIYRVLKPNSTIFSTFFLLNDESRRQMQRNKNRLNFKHSLGGGACYSINKKVLESAIAYDEIYIREIFEKFKLLIQEPISYGSWAGRDNFLDYQDIIVAKKN